jgi:hypothetical protein
MSTLSWEGPHPKDLKDIENAEFLMANASKYMLAPGSSISVEVDDDLANEVSHFAIEVLFSTPKEEGGFGCLPSMVNPDGNGTEISMSEALIQAEMLKQLNSVKVLTADAQVVGGVQYHTLFTFATSDARCTGASGTYDATVTLRSDGMLVMQKLFGAEPPADTHNTDMTAIIAGSVSAFVVLAAIAGFIAWRWYRTRKSYDKLKDVSKEVIRRVSALESGPAGEQIRRASVSLLLKQAITEAPVTRLKLFPSRVNKDSEAYDKGLLSPSAIMSPTPMSPSAHTTQSSV